MHISKVCLLHDSFPTGEQYPFNLEIFRKTDCIVFSRPVTFFIGENGTGKSTLLKAIARHCSIHIWEETGRARLNYNQYEDDLSRFLNVAQNADTIQGSFFASEIFRHFAEILDEWSVADPGSLEYFGKTSLVEKSHGQAHMTYFSHRCRRKGLYLLDEPENALSPRRQLELLALLRRFTAAGDVQFIIATHSPILLAYPDSDIYSFDTIPIRKIEYEDTDYFRIYRDFLNHRENYMESI
jgi:predicted ATPase